MIKLFAPAALIVCAALAATGFAQDSEDAQRLYNQAVKLLELGKGDSARDNFKTIIDKYPTSAYARLAKEGMEKPLIASVEFKGLAPLSEKEVRKYFELANAGLRPGRLYDPEYADQAQTLLAQMMAKKKIRAKSIGVNTKDLPDRKVAVTVTIVH